MKSNLNRSRLLTVSLAVLVAIVGCSLAFMGCGESEQYETEQYSPPETTQPEEPSVTPPPTNEPTPESPNSSTKTLNLNGNWQTYAVGIDVRLHITGNKMLFMTALGYDTYQFEIIENGTKIRLTYLENGEIVTYSFRYDPDLDCIVMGDLTYIRVQE